MAPSPLSSFLHLFLFCLLPLLSTTQHTGPSDLYPVAGNSSTGDPLLTTAVVEVPLQRGVLQWDHITGFGRKYYTIDLAHASILDTVVVVDRGHGLSETTNLSAICKGWSMYLTVNNSMPEGQSRYIERDRADMGEILLAAFVQMQQQSILCDLYSSAKWSVKDAAPGRWWVMVQTRGGTEQYENSTCRYGVWVKPNSRAVTLWVGGLSLILYVVWVMCTLAIALLPILQPGFHFYRPSIFLHQFLLRLPVDVALGSCFLTWRILKDVLRLLHWRPRLVAAGSTTHPGTGDDCDDQTELAVLVQQQQQHEDTPEGSLSREECEAIPVPVDILTEVEGDDGPSHIADGPVVPACDVGENLAASEGLPQPDPDAHELEDEDCCRICGDGGGEEPLIEPCACQGTMRYVHATCLNKWRQESLNTGRHENALRCEVCGERFHIVHPPISCMSVCRSCTHGVARLVCYLMTYVVCAYLWSWFIMATIGRGSCNAPYNNVSSDFGTKDIIVGIIYYAVAASHLYLCIYWQWILWLNELHRQNAPTQGAVFASRKNVGFVAYFFVASLIAELGMGYIVKYFFYLFAGTMVWIWDLPLTTGFLIMFFISMIGTFFFILWESFGGWHPMMNASLGTVMSRPQSP